MNEQSIPQVYNIPPWFPFLETLAKQLVEETKDDPLSLSHYIILLPHQRACRSLKEEFLRLLQKDSSLFLPQMLALGNLDEDLILFNQHSQKVELPDAISSLERLGTLMSLIMRHQQTNNPQGLKAPHATQVVQLAQELSRLVDQVGWEGIKLDQLSDLAPDDHAHHWQVTLDFLKIVAEFWPKILAEQKMVDPSVRQRSILQAYAKLWKSFPPDHPVIAAGSTGTIPATANLLQVVAHLPQGRVVLPGMDRFVPDEVWQTLDLTHPQYGLAKLLKKLNVSRETISDLPSLQKQPNPLSASFRGQLLSQALCPNATTTEVFSHTNLEDALQNFTYLQCNGAQEEALIIALIMRETLEKPDKTVCLITPDRTLVERVKVELERWQLVADDSAGLPLPLTIQGRFLLLLAEFLTQPFSAVSLLACLKNPFINSHLVGKVEKWVLRGHPPYQDFKSCRDYLASLGNEALTSWFDEFYNQSLPFLQLLEQKACDLTALLEAHIKAAEFLGGKTLWQGETGEACAHYLYNLIQSAAHFPAISPQDYPEVLKELMQAEAVRQPHGFHPQLRILGPLEARMLKADRVIMASLNEGTWPGHHDVDLWLNRPMREQLGLPLPERRVGLSAHDFSQGFCAPEVFLTRSARIDGTPTVPCRWLLRLETTMKANNLLSKVDQGQQWLAWQKLIDHPKAIKPWGQPHHNPPLS